MLDKEGLSRAEGIASKLLGIEVAATVRD
jgi:hypothetical protein